MKRAVARPLSQRWRHDTRRPSCGSTAGVVFQSVMQSSRSGLRRAARHEWGMTAIEARAGIANIWLELRASCLNVPISPNLEWLVIYRIPMDSKALDDALEE